MIKKIRNFKFVIRNCQRGMTYVELIVVLSIFSVLSSVVVFNYGGFQDKVDLKNQASDIAMQIVQAQRSALSGALPSPALQIFEIQNWKPTYGVYFFQTTIDNKHFVYFVDLDQDGIPRNPDCSAGGECLDKPFIAKNNSISSLDVCISSSSCSPINGDLAITFSRPNSSAIFKSSDSSFPSSFSYVQITTVSSKGAKAFIKLYPPGRVQVN